MSKIILFAQAVVLALTMGAVTLLWFGVIPEMREAIHAIHTERKAEDDRAAKRQEVQEATHKRIVANYAKALLLSEEKLRKYEKGD